MQLWPLPQTEQVVPLDPQASSIEPDTHLSWLQQPLQFDGLHASAAHLPFVQDCPLVQTEQYDPLAPQLEEEVCSTHTPLLQQPLQLAGPQEVGTGVASVVPVSSAQPAASILRPAANIQATIRDRAIRHLVVETDP
jgi:hypothetical protein